MKITIIIEHANERPANEVKPKITIVKAQKDKKPQFKPLTDFTPPVNGLNDGHGYFGNTNAAKTYRQGRKTHQCSNCGASNRRMSNKDGFCFECRPRGV